MNDDPVGAFAVDRRKVGLQHLTEVDRGVLIHPSLSGTRGYPVWHRILDLDRAARGQVTDASPIIHWRWRTRLLPFRMTGNRLNGNIVDEDQYLSVIYVTI